jgi:hypothetical protein
MYSGLIKIYFIIAAVVLLVFSVVGFYLYRESQLEQIQQMTQEKTYEPLKPREIEPPPIPLPGFSVEIKNKNVVYVSWGNLPLGSWRLDIFRNKINSADWIKWKTLIIGADEITSGRAEITLGRNEVADNYHYQVQVSGSTGDIVWISSSTPAVVPSPTSTPGTGGQGDSSTDTTPPPTSTSTTPSIPSPTSTPTSTPSSTPPAAAPTSSLPVQSPENGQYYYSPQGQITSTSSPQISGSFWAIHVNRNIEIGWQNLPVETKKIAVYRSTDPDGPWTILLQQNDPNIVGPEHIRLVDYSIYVPHYYFLKTLDQNDNVLASYDPVLLEALEPQ